MVRRNAWSEIYKTTKFVESIVDDVLKNKKVQMSRRDATKILYSIVNSGNQYQNFAKIARGDVQYKEHVKEEFFNRK